MDRRERAAAVGIAAVWVVCLWRAIDVVATHGVDLVVMDQWDFLVPLLEGEYGWIEKLRFQFRGSPHRMGAGWPLIELVARSSGLSTRADGFAIAGVLAVAGALAVVLVRRLTGRLEPWDAVLPLLFLSLRQWTTLVGTPDVSLGAMPVLLLVAAGLVLTLPSARARVVWLLVLDVACVYTGFALFAGLVIPTLLVREAWLGRLGRSESGLALLAALAIGASFFLGYDTTPATRPVARDVALGDYALYATNLFASALGARSTASLLAIGLLWPLVLGLPLADAARRMALGDRAPGPAVVWLLCAFGLCFVGANTIGRIGEGVSFAFTPRYVTLMLPALLGAWLAVRLAPRGRARAAALGLLTVVWVGGEVVASAREAPAMTELADAKRDWVRCYLRTRDVARCNATGRLAIYPYVDALPRIERGLGWLERHRLNLFSQRALAALPEPSPIENVLLISIDTLRADHVGWHGAPRETTPALSRLARRSIVFERAMSTSSWTLPAHGSLLTGTYPTRHGARDDGSRLSDAVPTLADVFREAGFETLGVVGHVYVASPFGFDRGFDVFDDTLIEGGTTNPRGDAVVDRLLEHLDARSTARRFFAFVHLYDPHWDYRAPEPWTRRFVASGYPGPIDGRYETMLPFLGGRGLGARDLEALVGYYDGEIAWVDAQIERLVAELERRGLRSSTLIAVTADHGEEFLDHGRLGHGRTLYEEQLHVPLLLQHASLPAELRREPVSLVDVAPTLLDLAGVPVPSGLAGRSLRDPAAADRVLFADSIRFGLEWYAARAGPYKVAQLPEAGGRAFFDLSRDPGERRPLRTDPSGGRLTAALEDYAARAETGWHLRVVAGAGRRVRFAGRLETDGRLVLPRRYASERLGEPAVVFHTFEPAADGRSIAIDVEASQHTGTIRFETDPPDARLRVIVERLEGGAVHAATGEILAARPLDLEPGDPRLTARFAAGDALADGIHLRAGDGRAATRAPSLSEQARRHLEALGYGRE